VVEYDRTCLKVPSIWGLVASKTLKARGLKKWRLTPLKGSAGKNGRNRMPSSLGFRSGAALASNEAERRQIPGGGTGD